MNKDKMMFYVYIFVMIVATTSSQLSLKYGISSMGEIPNNVKDGAFFLIKAFSKPFVLLSFVLTIVSALSWLSALSKAELSFAYPFSIISYVLILIISSLILKEHVSIMRWLGVIIIGIGIFIVSRS